MPVLSATDCITPAFRHTTRFMFRPFRLPFWLRIALLGLLTGEMGGNGFNVPSSFPNTNTSGGRAGTHGPFHWPNMGWFTLPHILELALIFALFIIAFTLIFTYINSIFRFMLFDAVLHGDIRIREGWRKWRDAGRKFFVWQIILAVVGWMVMVLFIFVPLMMLFGSHHIGFWHIDPLAIATLVIAFLLMMLVSVALSIIVILGKDFMVPIMALEGFGWQFAWRRFRLVARGHASEYVLYFVMKIVLRIAAGIATGIIAFFVMLILLVPIVIAVIGMVAAGAGATAVVKAMLITVGIVGGLLLFAFFLALSAMIGAPISFFFPAYSIFFFAGRYEPLGRIVFPPVPQAPPTPVVPPPPPDAPPLPA